MLDHLERLFRERCIDAIWSLHVSQMARYGFDRLIYGCTRFRRPEGFGNLDDTLFLSNHAPAFTEAYVHDGLFRHSPMVKWAADHEGDCSWNGIAATCDPGTLTEEERRVYELNRAHRVTAGYTVSFPSENLRNKAAIGLCAAPGISQAQVDAIWSEHRRDLMVANLAFHLRVSSLPFIGTRRGLTPRQREVLEWVGDGKTTADIATILGLTPATVEKHLRLAREVLDVETTAQAVLKASMQGQIFLNVADDQPPLAAAPPKAYK